MVSCAKLLMVFLSNLGWQISVWNTSCYCSSSWWWWWLLLWDLLERCKEIPFFFLRDLFGGGTWIRRADFCWRKILYSRSGCSFCQWQATTERGFNQLSTKIHGTVPASFVTGHFILYTVKNFSFLQSTSGAVRHRSSLLEDV